MHEFPANENITAKTARRLLDLRRCMDSTHRSADSYAATQSIKAAQSQGVFTQAIISFNGQIKNQIELKSFIIYFMTKLWHLNSNQIQ